jgi:hypothetical protein
MNAVTERRGEGLILSALRVPPHNLQAEQALLGAIMANNRAYEQVSEFLRAEHFANGVHQRIYETIQRRIDAGQAADAITLRGELEGTGILDPEGGVAYLAKLLTAMVAIINAGDYGRAIADAWIRRQLIHLGETMVNRAYGAEPDLQTPARSRISRRSCRCWPRAAAPRRRWSPPRRLARTCWMAWSPPGLTRAACSASTLVSAAQTGCSRVFVRPSSSWSVRGRPWARLPLA